MKEVFNSKKADIPVMILVIGILAVTAVAILSFIFVINKYSKSFSGYEFVEEANSRIDKYYFYKNAGLSTNSIDSLLGLNFDRNSGKRYIKIGKSDDSISVVYVLPD
jgi:flagellar basal body-associated protein FliL